MTYIAITPNAPAQLLENLKDGVDWGIAIGQGSLGLFMIAALVSFIIFQGK